MITSKQELIQLLPQFYQHFHIPTYLLSKDLQIIDSTQNFFKLEQNYFQSITTTTQIRSYKIYVNFSLEGYFFFYYPLENIEFICLGPFYPKKVTHQDKPSDFPLLNHVTSSYTLDDFFNLPYYTLKTKDQVLFIYQIITGKCLDEHELKLSFQKPSFDPLYQDEKLNQELFTIRENNLHDFSYSYEQKIINCIQNENSTQARLLMNELLQIKDNRQLSTNQLQSMKYKLVSAIAIYTRAVIDTGVPIAKAYTLSDIYIIKIDNVQSSQQIFNIICDSIVDFTKLVKRYKHSQHPYWIKLCKNYISHHLHQNITLQNLADLTDMNPNYLSSQFKKITGQSIKQYINQTKIKEAQFLIQNSHYSLSEISEILNFSNQSHFHKVFKNIVGMNPHQYKNKR